MALKPAIFYYAQCNVCGHVLDSEYAWSSPLEAHDDADNSDWTQIAIPGDVILICTGHTVQAPDECTACDGPLDHYGWRMYGGNLYQTCPNETCNHPNEITLKADPK